MSAIGFTAKLDGSPSHLYDGGKLSALLAVPAKVHGKLEGEYRPEPMDQFRVWDVQGKKVLMERDPATGYSYWTARKDL